MTAITQSPAVTVDTTSIVLSAALGTYTNLSALAQAAVSLKTDAKNASADGKSMTGRLGLAYAVSVRKAAQGDADAKVQVDAIDAENFSDKKSKSQGAFYALRGILSQARTVGKSDTVLATDSVISTIYKKMKEAEAKEQAALDSDITITKAAALHLGMTVSEFLSKTSPEEQASVKASIKVALEGLQEAEKASGVTLEQVHAWLEAAPHEEVTALYDLIGASLEQFRKAA